MQKAIEAYRDLLATAEKHPEVFEDDSTVKNIKYSLRRLEVSQRFGIPLEMHHNEGPNSYRVVRAYDDWTRVALHGPESISWSDDGRQPEDEWLLCISFPTGAYIFGEAYPAATFDAFFAELKAFGAKYCDTNNSSLYFTEENSKAVYDAFWDIFKKYKALVTDELKAKRRAELEAELAKLNKE